MRKLDLKTRIQILNLLCEGMSMRAVARIADVSFNTVAKLLIDAGTVCAEMHDEMVQGVKASRIQCDEIWAFNYCKQKTVKSAKAAPADAGDIWTWTGIDADSKLIVSYLVGDRSGEAAIELMDDLRSRLTNRVQLSTDGHRAYLEAVEGAFGADVDYGQIVKLYGPTIDKGGRYSPAECTGIRKRSVEGRPDMAHVSTSYVEAHNKTMRMHMRRFTRLTNGHSKKVANHAHMVALYTMFYNFIRTHSKLRTTPAMAAGIADTFLGFEAIVDRIDAAHAPKPRGPYKKRVTEISK
ncbi:helix-turn-helix domain-containing protein [Rhizorhapis sp. SPR117]|uniref:helix-turn-helix domain-containing protein n=1 Tax=Rhizorhapis sp. SPR117 TaxID=2912611 RepID=UPI001F29BA1E|nr:helix-turn-helix domain-containing protein [Rhizorhapis sp. SPR117]